MHKYLLATAAFGMLGGAIIADPVLAEPVPLDPAAAELITAGTSGYGGYGYRPMYPSVPLDFSKHVDLKDMIQNYVRSYIDSTVYLHGNVATSEGAATALGPHTYTSSTFGANTVAGVMSQSVGIVESASSY